MDIKRKTIMTLWWMAFVMAVVNTYAFCVQFAEHNKIPDTEGYARWVIIAICFKWWFEAITRKPPIMIMGDFYSVSGGHGKRIRR